MPDNENKLATIEPETREETFLQDIADGTQTLTPAVRKEEFLRRIAAKPGVPSIAESDEGKVLTVDNGEAAWGEASSLPEITAQDEGKVLTVESGEAVWGEGGGGSSLGVTHVGVRGLADMADAPDETTTYSQYDTPGDYAGLAKVFSQTAPVDFAFQYSDSDEDGILLVFTTDVPEDEGLHENKVISMYYSYDEAELVEPAEDDPSGAYYFLTPTASFYTKKMTEDMKIVVPAGVSFKWVRGNRIN